VLTGHYEPPVNPPDPVAAALKHLVRAPEAAPPDSAPRCRTWRPSSTPKDRSPGCDGVMPVVWPPPAEKLANRKVRCSKCRHVREPCADGKVRAHRAP
jgi:hypothetical protein